MLDMVAHVFNFSTWDAEAEGSVRGQGQAGLHCKFKAILNCTVKSCFKGGGRAWFLQWSTTSAIKDKA